MTERSFRISFKEMRGQLERVRGRIHEGEMRMERKHTHTGVKSTNERTVEGQTWTEQLKRGRMNEVMMWIKS